MARIALLERDAMFAATVADRLHVAGYRVELLDRPDQALALALDGRIDLVISEMVLGASTAVDLIDQLRSRPEGRSIPVLVLSGETEVGQRLALLKAGADDYVQLPCDPEELVLRASRLLGSNSDELRVLEGDFSQHPAKELLQYIHNAGKGGILSLRGAGGTSGRIQFVRGAAVAAKLERLEGRDALLAILGLAGGRFRFEAARGETPEAGSGPQLPLPQLLLYAAWLDDELEQRRPFAGSSGTPLRITGRELPALGPLAQLPYGPVLDHLKSHPQSRLYDLLAAGFAPPQEVRLATAVLLEHGVVETPPARRVPSTSEISSSVYLDIAIGTLLLRARQAGLGRQVLSLLLLAEAGAWDSLTALMEPVRHHETLGPLVTKLDRRRGGSAIYATEGGQLALHVQELGGAVVDQIGGVLPSCGGVLVWLDDGAEVPSVLGLMDRFEGADPAAQGIVVCQDETPRREIQRAIEGRDRWSLSPHAPRSLVGLLRFFRVGGRTP
ncbi:MAG: response regulator [Acidobacteriota bacterium]